MVCVFIVFTNDHIFLIHGVIQIRSVKVGNLSSGATEHDIKEFFSFSGEVETIDIQGLVFANCFLPFCYFCSLR